MDHDKGLVGCGVFFLKDVNPSVMGHIFLLRESFIFFLRFYLFIHKRHREREADTGRGRRRLHAESLMRDSIPGPLGSCPEPKADAQPLSHPGAPGVEIS